MDAKKKIVFGSVKNKITASDLLEERAQCDFNVPGGKILKYMDFYYSFDRYTKMDEICSNDPVLKNTHKFYEMTREEKMTSHMKKFRRL
jgi:hypothetical protein